jgi:hypothetical protein
VSGVHLIDHFVLGGRRFCKSRRSLDVESDTEEANDADAVRVLFGPHPPLTLVIPPRIGGDRESMRSD